MATLIAANYQSTTITSYGGMSMSCGTLKANTLYTLKCRYKYTKNTSTSPQIMCYNSNWSHTGGIYDNSSDGIMKTRIVTFTSYTSAINYSIGCYAWSYNDQNNGGGKTGVLEVDWYELWEGDATQFSLTDAIALSENKSATDFLNIGGTIDTTSSYYNKCTNHAYFSTAEPQNAVRSWMGYYYKNATKLQSASLSATSVGAGGGTITISYNIKDEWTNGKKTGISGVKPTITSTLGTVGTIGTTNSSGNGTTTLTIASRGTTYGAALSGTVKVAYGGVEKTLTFSQAANTITIESVTGSPGTLTAKSFGPGANTGDVTATSATASAVLAFASGGNNKVTINYGNTNSDAYGTWSFSSYSSTSNQTWLTINSSSWNKVNVTAATRGTTEGANRSATLTRTENGFTFKLKSTYGGASKTSTATKCTCTITQTENKITSVSLSASVSSGTLTAVSAAGGTVTWTPTVKYSSGSTSSDTSKFTPTYSVANYATLTGFATKSYSASTGNYNYQQIGGSYSVASGEKFLCTLGSASVTAGSPAGYTILAYDLSESQNRGGVQLSNSKLTDVITSNAADTVEFILYAGVSGATAGVAITYSNLCISRMNTVGSGATQSGNKTTWASLGTTVGSRNASVTVSVKSTYTTTAVTAIAYTAQAYNTITSYDIPQMKGVKWSALIAAGGGTATPTVTSYNQVATWSSGSKSNITSGASISFARAQIVQNTDPEFYNGANSINKYDNANSGKTTLTRITSGYPSGIPNNSGVAYKLQNTGSGAVPNLGGFYHAYAGTAGQTYLWTFDAYVPSGYTLQHNHNSLGTGGSFTWRSPSSGTGSWRTYSIEVYFGTSNSSAFFCSLVGTAGTSSTPVVWYIANSKICKISNVSATTPTINTSTGAVTLGTRGTTIGSAGVVDTYGAVVGTITMNGKTGKFVAAPSQQANAVTSIKAEVANTDTSSCHWYVSPGTLSNKIAAAGGTGTVVGNGTCKFTFTSGSTEYKGSGPYNGNTITFSRTYKISGTTATTSNGFTLNTSTGAVTASNNTTTSDRNVNITSDLTVSWGSLSNTLSQSRYVYQAAGSKIYGDPTVTFSYATFAAAGATKTPTFSYSQVWTWNGVSGSGGTVNSGATDIVYGMTAKTGFTLNSTSTGSITAANNTTTSARSTTASVSFKLNGKTGSKTATVSQNAGTRTYQIVLDPSSITWAASGGSQSVTVKYNTLWNNIKTAGPTALTGYTVGSLSNCTTSGTSGTTTVTVGHNTTSGTRNVSATFSKSGYTSATLTGTQNKPVTSTATVYRVSSLSSSALTIGYSSSTGSISVYMDKATRTYYKNTTSSAAFTTTTGTWSRVTGQEAAAAGSNLSFYTYFESINGSDTGWIRTGTPTNSLANGTSTSAAIWYANYAYDANTNGERQVKMLIVHSTADDVSGAGKNYCTITQSAGPAQIPIQVWGRNENGTDIYCSFSNCKVRVYQNGTSSWSEVSNLSWGGGVSGYDSTSTRKQLVNGNWSSVDRLTYNSITQVMIDFGTTTIENSLNSSRYRCCEVWAEVCEGNIADGSYASGRYVSTSAVISTNYSPLQSNDGGTHTFTFYGSGIDGSGNYYSGAPLNDNSVVVIFFRFYDS